MSRHWGRPRRVHIFHLVLNIPESGVWRTVWASPLIPDQGQKGCWSPLQETGKYEASYQCGTHAHTHWKQFGVSSQASVQARWMVNDYRAGTEPGDNDHSTMALPSVFYIHHLFWIWFHFSLVFQIKSSRFTGLFLSQEFSAQNQLKVVFPSVTTKV